MKSQFSAIVLAAGKGTRMKTSLPKVLHPVAGRPMIVRVIESLKAAGVNDIRVIVGFGEKLVRSQVEPLGVNCFLQKEQLGTADAVKCGNLDTALENTLIINGDHPLIEASDLTSLMDRYFAQKLDLAVCSARLKKPANFGRIVRYHGRLNAIVEAKDASAETLKINEVNTGIYLVDTDLLREALLSVGPQNAAGEFYLTDIVSIAEKQGGAIDAIEGHRRVAFGVNSQVELASASRYAFRRKNRELMEAGVMLVDPEKTYIEDTVTVAPGAFISPQVHLKGMTDVAGGVVIEEGCHVVDSEIGLNAHLKAYSYLEEAIVGQDCHVGPFARLRPQTRLRKAARVGNFVEMKKVDFGEGSKAGHLAYLGDAEVGKNVNIGCGAITVNYQVDRKKYKTKIGDDVFIGSDTQLIAPIEVADKAVVGAGSTICKDVPERALALGRARQVNRENYNKD